MAKFLKRFIVMRSKLIVASICLILFSLILLLSCGHKKENKGNITTFVAENKEVVTRLYYTGIIQPLKIETVSSIVDGTIKKINFKYGSTIQKGEMLITIASTKLQEDYRTALTNYLTSKNNYIASQNSYNGTKALYEAGIESKENYDNQKNSLESNLLTYINARSKLEDTLGNIPGFNKKIEELNLDNMKSVKELLEKKFDEIQIASPVSGVALFPQRSEETTTEEKGDKEIHVGSEVKKGQVLLSVGDLAGISVPLKVSEADINLIKPDQPVVVTSDSLPGIQLNGLVVTVGSQAKVSGSGGGELATFPVSVSVPGLTDEARKLIRIGMSAKVEVDIKNPPQIVIPIAAVFSKDGKEYVTVVDDKGHDKDVMIEPQQPTPDGMIVIKKGLKVGDKVLVRD